MKKLLCVLGSMICFYILYIFLQRNKYNVFCKELEEKGGKESE